VGCTIRSKSWTPIAFSSSAMCMLIRDCARNDALAAAENPPWRATATKLTIQSSR
jgi:hypothetical protein